ncbi:DUF4349 domain-containing protein [Candidatus Micrarchaeota archaeon]|nr:DUF4349 domain-containing protein [Candidatus Micrarchaeota archaeon]
MNKILIGIIMVSVLLLGCTMPLEQQDNYGPTNGQELYPRTAYGQNEYTSDLVDSGSGKMVIKTGGISVLVPQGTLEDKYAALTVLLQNNNGEISSVNFNEYSTEMGYRIVAKINPDKFDIVFAELKKLGEVKSADTNLEDVTTQYQDLNIRISNLEKELGALNDLYNRTSKISDILEIRNEINTVQTQLEMYTQQKMDLERQVAKSTISVYIYEEKDALDKNLLVPLGDLGGIFFGAMGAAIMLLAGFAGFVLPGALVGGLVYLGWKKFFVKKSK